MADHLSDEEQLEALKKWWRRNGTSILLMVTLTLGGWYGWHYWQNRQQQQGEESSVVFMAMLDAASQWEKDSSETNAAAVAAQAETLKKLGKGSLYARYGALMLAKLSVADKEYDNAVAELQWALEQSDDPAMQALVRLRLANVEYARDNSAQALALLEEPHPQHFNALYLELKGDILTAQGDNDQARAAYQAALEQVDESDSRAKALLELKINEVMPVAASTAETGKEEA